MRSLNGNESKYTMLFNDNINIIALLEDDEKGIVFNKILHYANDLDFDIGDNRLIQTTWAHFKNQMDRDIVKYDKTISTNSIGGKKSSLKKWHKDLYAKVEAKEMSLDEAFVIVKDRKDSKYTYKNDESTHKKVKSTHDIVSNKKKNTNTNNNINTNTNIIKDKPFSNTYYSLWDEYPNKRSPKRANVDVGRRVGYIYSVIVKRNKEKKKLNPKEVFEIAINLDESNSKYYTYTQFENVVIKGIKDAFAGSIPRYPADTLEMFLGKGISATAENKKNQFE